MGWGGGGGLTTWHLQEDMEFSRVDIIVHQKITKLQEKRVDELRNERLEMQRRYSAAVRARALPLLTRLQVACPS